MTTNEKRTPQKRRSSFGNVRKTAAGSFQARYTAPDGTPRKAPHTYKTMREAREFLARMQVNQVDGKWKDPKRSVPTLRGYIPHFQTTRQGRGGAVKPSTMALSEQQLARYILPRFGDKRMDEISVQEVNAWHATLPAHPSLRRQVYSLLKAIMNCALREGLLRSDRNPCQVVGGGQNRYDARPHMDLESVDAILARLEGDMRVLATLAFDAHLRLGEVLALERQDVDLQRMRVHVRNAVTEVNNEQVRSSPKSGKSRMIDVDDEMVQVLIEFLMTRPKVQGDRMFARADGSTLRHYHVHTAWKRARSSAGLDQYRFHDLRHAGLTLAAEAHLSIAQLMHRAGHSTFAAVMNYQHRAVERGALESSAIAARKAEERMSSAG